MRAFEIKYDIEDVFPVQCVLLFADVASIFRAYGEYRKKG